MQDSTPILERFEAHQPSIAPEDPALAFVSALLEEYGDEWGNKSMFHYRWRYQPDADRPPSASPADHGRAGHARRRAGPRRRRRAHDGAVRFVGSNRRPSPSSRPRSSTRWRSSRRISRRGRTFWAAGRRWPTSDCGGSSTRRRPIRRPAPSCAPGAEVMAWCSACCAEERRAVRGVAGARTDAEPLLRDEVAGLFLPWSAANAAAIAAGEKTFAILGGRRSQEPQKYHARSLAELRRKYTAADVAPGLDAILKESGSGLPVLFDVPLPGPRAPQRAS